LKFLLKFIFFNFWLPKPDFERIFKKCGSAKDYFLSVKFFGVFHEVWPETGHKRIMQRSGFWPFRLNRGEVLECALMEGYSE
jgi:hypothetical protein